MSPKWNIRGFNLSEHVFAKSVQARNRDHFQIHRHFLHSDNFLMTGVSSCGPSLTLRIDRVPTGLGTPAELSILKLQDGNQAWLPRRTDAAGS